MSIYINIKLYIFAFVIHFIFLYKPVGANGTSRFFNFIMHYTFDYIISRLNEAIDSDDVCALAAEIEFYFSKEDVFVLKEMLKNTFDNNSTSGVNVLYINYLLNYLYDSSDRD